VEVAQDVSEDLLYLMACAVNDVSPDPERVLRMDLNAVLGLAKFHSVAAMAGLALRKLAPLSPKWEGVVASSEYRYALMGAERGRVITSLAHEGVRCACLKGIILAEHYPSPVMREMCDNDILYEYTPENARTVRHVMEGMGYQTKSFDQTNTDEYMRTPIFNFEMHAALESGETAFRRQGDRVFDGVWERVIPLASEPGAYALDPTDFYLYFVSHAYKHFRTGSIGVRVLADARIVQGAYEGRLDDRRLNDGLAALGAVDFAANLDELAMGLLGDPTRTAAYLHNLTPKQGETLSVMLGSGTYGTQSTVIHRRLEKVESEPGQAGNVRRRYLMQRVFPSTELMKSFFPACRRYPVLLPYFYVYRIIRGVATKRTSIKSELGILDSELASSEKSSQAARNQGD
jgi:hypothetical protein